MQLLDGVGGTGALADVPIGSDAMKWLSQEDHSRLTRRSYALPLGIFVADVSIYVLLILGTLRFEGIGARLLCSFLAGFMISVLFVIGHDACHQSLTPSRAVNHVLGRLAFLLPLHAYSLFELSHNRQHHPFVNLKGKDFVWLPISKREYDRLSVFAKAVYRWHRGPFGPLTYNLASIWMRRYVFPYGPGITRRRAVYWLDSAIVCGFFACQVALVSSLVGPGQRWVASMLLAVVLPFVVWNFLFSVVTFLQHTHPQLVWFQREQDWTFLKAQIGGTVHVVFPWPLNRLAHSIMEHPAHHALPAIPLYHLREAQQRLSSAFPGQTIRFDWSLREHLDIQRRCKLYDYENYRWVDYSGQPTS